MSLGLAAQILGIGLAAVIALIAVVQEKGKSRRQKGVMLGLLVVAGVVAAFGTWWDRREAAKESEAVEAAIDRIAASKGNEEAMRRLVEAASKLSGEIARGSADDIVDLQARQLPDARAIRDADLVEFKRRAVALRAEWEPAARFILQTFDSQLEAWRARGQEMQINPQPSDDLGKMIRIGNEPEEPSPSRIAILPDGTRISLVTRPGHYDEGEFVSPWRAGVAFEPGPNAGATTAPVVIEFFPHPTFSRIARKPHINVYEQIWSGRPSLSDETFTKTIADEIAATIFAAMKQAEPKQ